jgi:hypothetical protein
MYFFLNKKFNYLGYSFEKLNKLVLFVLYIKKDNYSKR